MHLSIIPDAAHWCHPKGCCVQKVPLFQSWEPLLKKIQKKA
jgi:hypothetical protein